MNFDFTSPDPEQKAREELLRHLEVVQPTMKPCEYLDYRRAKLDQFNTILQHVYKFQRSLLSKGGDGNAVS